MGQAFTWIITIALLVLAIGVWALVLLQSSVSSQLEGVFGQLVSLRADAGVTRDLVRGIYEQQQRAVELMEETPEGRYSREERRRLSVQHRSTHGSGESSNT